MVSMVFTGKRFIKQILAKKNDFPPLTRPGCGYIENWIVVLRNSMYSHGRCIVGQLERMIVESIDYVLCLYTLRNIN